MATIRYVFRDPLTIQGSEKADPQKIGEALAVLAGKEGELTPPVVVEAAKNPRHILHKHFEWNDTKAAEKYRLDQARVLIRAIRIEDEDVEGGEAPAFISISADGGVSYRTLEKVRESVDLQSRVLVQAEKDLAAWQKRYKSLRDICEIVERARTALAKKRAKAETRAGATAN